MKGEWLSFVDAFEFEAGRVAAWVEGDLKVLEEADASEESGYGEGSRKGRVDIDDLVADVELDGMDPDILRPADAGSLLFPTGFEVDADRCCDGVVEDAVCCAGVDDGLEVPGSLSALASHAHANEWIEMDCAVFLWKGTVGNCLLYTSRCV